MINLILRKLEKSNRLIIRFPKIKNRKITRGKLKAYPFKTSKTKIKKKLWIFSKKEMNKIPILQQIN